jgi:FecR-like protein/outer membrane lipoprotein YfiO
MSRLPLGSDPGEMLKQLAQEKVASVPEDASPERRERLVRSMKDAVVRSVETAERSRRWRRGSLVMAAAAGFLLLSGLLLKEWRSGDAIAAVAGLDGVSGTVVVTHDGKGNVIGAGERPLKEGDALQTAAGARAHLQTIKASIVLSESTELRISRPSAAEERISLRRGRVDVSVDKTIETKRAVVVETPDAEVVVRGTVFDVRVEPMAGATTTRVHVTRGSVWVLAQGVQVALLSAGQSWSSTSGTEGAEAPARATSAGTSTPAVRREPEAEAEAPPAVAHRDAEMPAARRESGMLVARRDGDSRPLVAKPTRATRRDVDTEVATPPSSAKSAVAAANNASARRTGTLAEENRLFAAGVEARNRGDAARAVELFSELLSNYPQSTLREVAQVERFRALKSAGQASRASTEARRYLAEHPDGAARTEARDLALDSQD